MVQPRAAVSPSRQPTAHAAGDAAGLHWGFTVCRTAWDEVRSRALLFLIRSRRIPYRPGMAAANASARRQRSAILASPLHELTGFCLAVNCLDPQCRRDRMFAISDLADFYGRQRTVAEVLQRMQCSERCGGRVAAAWLVPGPILNARVRLRRVALLGLEARE